MASRESKDAHCLDPLVPSLRERFDEVRSFNAWEDLLSGDTANLKLFAEAEFPVAVVSSAGTIDLLNLVRPRETYLCLGIEHGIAPFKSYTYSRSLLSSDFYLAPTRGWAERLVRLYPDQRAKIRLGGYPKIEEMKDHLKSESIGGEKALSPHEEGGPDCTRILVLLSWGVREDAFKLLPDHSFIDYLLHPADSRKLDSFEFRQARIHVSRPEVTYPLIGGASMVIGDFSSLTLECIFLGKRVAFLIDASLYDVSCDLDNAFSKRDSPDFGRIPGTSDGIRSDHALTAFQFMTLVAECGTDMKEWDQRAPKALIDLAYLPSADVDNREICAAELSDITDRYRSIGRGVNDNRRALDRVECLCFLFEAYPALLSRLPDRIGLEHYLEQMGRPDDGNACAKALSVCQTLNRSPEAARKRTMELSEDPAEEVLAIIGQAAQVDSDRACSILDAVNEHVLPSYHRMRRDRAISDSDRIRHGAKLASCRGVEAEDLVQLAHAYAKEERLADALFWISKAIDARPCDGELLRFQSSILERMGLVEEALAAAEEAQSYGADPRAITSDIVRLRERYVSDLRKNAAAGNTASRLACYAKLASSGRAEADDLMQLAHAYASEDRLADALFWISNALEDRPCDGELLRFQASMLERLEQVEPALIAAEKAKSLGADAQAISSDIARLRCRLVSDLRAGASSSDFSKAVGCYTKLLHMREVRPVDVLLIAAKIAALPMRLLLRLIMRSVPPHVVWGHSRPDLRGRLSQS